jgi:hypothetical protein
MPQRRTIYDQRPPAERGIIVLGDSTPDFPVEFNRKLQAFDKDLLIMWHRPPHWPPHKRGAWKIEMCIRHNGQYRGDGKPHHDHVCNRSYVMMCQDDDGTPRPLGEWVFEQLGKMRQNSEGYGGQTERGLRNFIQASDNLDQELAAKREADSEDVKRYNRKEKRVQINKLMTLIERHDLRPNK